MSVVRALTHPTDAVLSNHRNHGHFLTYSGDFLGLVAEIMGRAPGVCGGIGGSQHLAFRRFHSNGVQGGMTGIGVGQALAIQRRQEDGVAAIIIGDGTLGQGLVYESMNLASVWGVPALFVVENNGIAQTTPTSTTSAGTLAGRAQAFGIRHWRLDDAAPDFLESVESIVQETRRSRKPGFLIVDTRRMGPHSKGDDLRSSADLAAIRDRDPLEAIGRKLAAADREELRRSVTAFVGEACRAAASAPPASELVASRSVFALSSPHQVAPARLHSAANHSGRTVRSDLNAALAELLAASSKVILLGEDLHDPYGGAFKVTAGLSSRFPGQVLSTPISEAGIVGAGIGLALHGWRPIVEIMFADFVSLACDQIFNHAVKFAGMFAGAETPLVIRAAAGGGRGYGPTHSQDPVALLCAIPGLTVIYPSARYSPGELLSNAVSCWPYPTVLLEHKLLYGAPVERRGYRTVEPSAEDPGAALFPLLLGGDSDADLTLVAYGGMVEAAEAVASSSLHASTAAPRGTRPTYVVEPDRDFDEAEAEAEAAVFAQAAAESGAKAESGATAEAADAAEAAAAAAAEAMKEVSSADAAADPEPARVRRPFKLEVAEEPSEAEAEAQALREALSLVLDSDPPEGPEVDPGYEPATNAQVQPGEALADMPVATIASSKKSGAGGGEPAVPAESAEPAESADGGSETENGAAATTPDAADAATEPQPRRGGIFRRIRRG